MAEQSVRWGSSSPKMTHTISSLNEPGENLVGDQISRLRQAQRTVRLLQLIKPDQFLNVRLGFHYQVFSCGVGAESNAQIPYSTILLHWPFIGDLFHKLIGGSSHVGGALIVRRGAG